MTTSNSSDPVSTTAEGVASAPETVQDTTKTAEPVARADAASAASSVAPSVDGSTAPVQPPAFQPNFKFKAFGKEHELDAFWHGLIKDADSEKKVKDVFTKAYAFDDTKTRYESSQKEFNGLLGEYQALDKDVARVMKFKNDGDYDNFFKSIKISDQDLFQYVQQKLERLNLPPDQQRAFDRQAQERQRIYDLEAQNQQMGEQFQTQAVQARTMQLDMTLSRPDISQAASSWDQRAGRIGAFRDLVIEHAQNVFYSTGQDLSAEMAAQAVLQRFGGFLNGGQSQVAAPVAGPTGLAAPQSHAKPVIPAVSGKGTSPVKKVPKSIDDLRAMAKEMGA